MNRKNEHHVASIFVKVSQTFSGESLCCRYSVSISTFELEACQRGDIEVVGTEEIIYMK